MSKPSQTPFGLLPALALSGLERRSTAMVGLKQWRRFFTPQPTKWSEAGKFYPSWITPGAGLGSGCHE
jgi:hypothetical protein